MTTNNSLYTNVIDNKFVTPEMIISEEMAVQMKEKANIRFHACKPLLEGMLKNMDKLLDY